jgi:hypothetical protein
VAQYSEEIQDALDLITEFGGPGSLRVPGQSLADPDKPWRATDAADVQWPCPVVVIENPTGRQAFLPMGALPDGVVPVKGWAIHDGGDRVWEITHDPAILNPNGLEPILAICEVKAWPI